MLSVVIYCRVSTEDQVDNYSLGDQLDRCRIYCEKKNYLVRAEYQEDCTGTTPDRPEMNRLLELVARGGIQRVICLDLDRFARSVSAQFVLENDLNKYGVEVEYVLNEFADSAAGRLQKNMLIAFAQFERDQIRARLDRGTIARLKSGKLIPTGITPFGYKYQDGMYEIVPHEAEIVRYIYREIVHRPQRSVLKDIQAMGPISRTGKVMVLGSLIGILKHGRLYAGEYTWKEHVIPVPAIITKEQAAAAKAAQDRRVRKRSPSTKTIELAAGRAKCVHCGKNISIARPRSRNKKFRYSYYYCPNKECKVNFRGPDLDEALWNDLAEQLKQPDRIIKAYREQQKLKEQEHSQTYSRIAALGAEIEAQRVSLNKLLSLYLDSQIERNLLDSKASEINQKITSYQALKADLESSLQAVAIDEKALKDLCEHISAGIDLFDFAERRQVLALLQVEVWLRNDGYLTYNCVFQNELDPLIRHSLILKSQHTAEQLHRSCAVGI